MEEQQYKQQIINDVKEANRLYNEAWSEGCDEIEIDIELLERLAQYARLLAIGIGENYGHF